MEDKGTGLLLLIFLSRGRQVDTGMRRRPFRILRKHGVEKQGFTGDAQEKSQQVSAGMEVARTQDPNSGSAHGKRIGICRNLTMHKN